MPIGSATTGTFQVQQGRVITYDLAKTKNAKGFPPERTFLPGERILIDTSVHTAGELAHFRKDTIRHLEI